MRKPKTGCDNLVSVHDFGKPKGYEHEFGKSRAYALETRLELELHE